MKPSLALQTNRDAIRTVVERHRACNARVFGSVLHGDDHEGATHQQRGNGDAGERGPDTRQQYANHHQQMGRSPHAQAVRVLQAPRHHDGGDSRRKPEQGPGRRRDAQLLCSAQGVGKLLFVQQRANEQISDPWDGDALLLGEVAWHAMGLKPVVKGPRESG